MKKVIFLLLLPVILFAQPEYIGELQVELINKGSSWNVTIALTEVSARWDENDDLTESYGYLDENVVSFDEYAYFDNVKDISNDLPVFANGLYKISAIESGTVQAYFYMDWRTTEMITDRSFKYDVINNNFRNWENSQTINYSYQTHWDLGSTTQNTVGLEDFWVNSLALVTTQNNNPWLIWGKYPNNDFVVSYYKIYKKKNSQNFVLYDTSTDPNYIDDEETVVTGPPIANETTAKYKITAVGYIGESETLSETSASNEVEARIEGEPPQKTNYNSEGLSNYNYNLKQNYPNPFNPSTIISWTSPKDDFVTLKVYDVLGREVATLVNEYKIAGEHTIDFNAKELSSGVYIYRIRIGEYIQARSLILQK